MSLLLCLFLAVPQQARTWTIDGEPQKAAVVRTSASYVWFETEDGDGIRVARKDIVPAERRAIAAIERSMSKASKPVATKGGKGKPPHC